MASKRGWTPLFLNELPHRTGTPLRARVTRRTASCSWAHVNRVLVFFFPPPAYIQAQHHKNTYFRGGYSIKVVTKICQEQFGKLVVQISNLEAQKHAVGVLPGCGGGGGGVSSAATYQNAPAQLRPSWLLWPPSRALPRQSGQAGYCQTLGHHLSKILASRGVSGWLPSPPHLRSFCHFQQESTNHKCLKYIYADILLIFWLVLENYLQQDWIGLQLPSNAFNRKSKARQKKLTFFLSVHFTTVNMMRLLSHLLCCGFIHLIKETNAGDMVLLCLPPHSERLRLLGDSKQQKRVSSGRAQIREQCINEKGSIYLWLTSTPAEASNTATAPSRTRSARSTSRVKSTCPVSPHRESCLIFYTNIFISTSLLILPGVSMRFIL